MNNLIKRIFSSIILLPIVFYSIIEGKYLLAILILIFFSIACQEWYIMTRKKKYQIYGYIFLIFSFFSFYKIALDKSLIFFVIFICISTDIGGFIFGKFFKGPKLTKISPKKTYSGMLGGYFLSLISLILMFKYFNFVNNFFNLFIITIIISTSSQIGDLIISYFKRLSKVKDTGNVIPGHGGVLDRIDGMIFTFPIMYLINYFEIFKTL